jgi:hypothetical protein
MHQLTTGSLKSKSALIGQNPEAVLINLNESRELDLLKVFAFESPGRYEIVDYGQTVNGEIQKLDDQYRVLYRPFYNFSGEDVWSFKVYDFEGKQNIFLKLNFKIQGESGGPIAVDDRYSTSSEVEMSVMDNDIFDEEVPTYVSKLVTSPKHGEVKLSENIFYYKVKEGYRGKDFFRYELRDEQDRVTQATVRVIISPDGKQYPEVNQEVKELPVRVIFIGGSEEPLTDSVEADAQKVLEIMNQTLMYEEQASNKYYLSQSLHVTDNQLTSMSMDDYATLTQRYGVSGSLTVAFVKNINDSILGLSYVGCTTTGCPYTSPAGGQANSLTVTEYSRLKKSNGEYITNFQGATFVHELGHHMGLEHVLDLDFNSSNDSEGGYISYRLCDLDVSYYQHRISINYPGVVEDPTKGKWPVMGHTMYPYYSSSRKGGFFSEAYGPVLSQIFKCYNQRSAGGLL